MRIEPSDIKEPKTIRPKRFDGSAPFDVEMVHRGVRLRRMTDPPKLSHRWIVETSTAGQRLAADKAEHVRFLMMTEREQTALAELFVATLNEATSAMKDACYD